MLNRFEKQLLLPLDALGPFQRRAVAELEGWVAKVVAEAGLGSAQHAFSGFHQGTVASLVLGASKFEDANAKRWFPDDDVVIAVAAAAAAAAASAARKGPGRSASVEARGSSEDSGGLSSGGGGGGEGLVDPEASAGAPMGSAVADGLAFLKFRLGRLAHPAAVFLSRELQSLRAAPPSSAQSPPLAKQKGRELRYFERQMDLFAAVDTAVEEASELLADDGDSSGGESGGSGGSSCPMVFVMTHSPA